MDEGSKSHFFSFEPGQRRVIILLVLIFCSYLCVRLLIDRHYASDPQPHDGERASEVADKIDPNTADAATLAALPQLGEKRAREIIAYRERAMTRSSSRPAFTRAEDLLKIKGVGYALMSQMRPYLQFPSTAPASAP